jgi:PAS domain S-box-containing protein
VETLASHAETFFRLTDDLGLTGNKDGYFEAASNAWTRVLGFSSEELAKRPLVELVHPEDQEAWRSWIARLAQGEPLPELECRLQTKAGTHRWLRFRGTTDPDRSLLFVLGRDIHGTKEGKAFSDLFFNAASVGLNLCAMDGTWIESNPAFLKMIGYSKEQADGKLTYWHLTPRKYDEQEQYQLKCLREEGKYGPYEKEFIRSDGSLVPVRLNGFIIQKDNLPYIWSIIEDISAERALDAERKKLEADLRAAIEVRDDFLSIASHELKTPLTALTLQLNLADSVLRGNQSLGPGKVMDLVERGVESCRRINALLGDLLDITRIRVGKLNLEKVEMDLKAAAEGVMGMMAEQIRAAGCEVQLRADGPVWGKWDPNRINQVISNLLSNALKFAGSKPIELRVQQDAGRSRALLSVKDQGGGIDSQLQQIIFERFARGASKERIGGLGLGLYIVRQVLEAHGGSVRVQSEPGAGALFVVELPLGPPNPTETGLQPGSVTP